MMGRRLLVPRFHNGVCFFNFGDLCEADKGAADFQAVCTHFHTVLMLGVPQLTIEEHNAARRFVTLVDELYEHQVRFICTAAAPPSLLFASLDSDEHSSLRTGGFGTDRPGGPSADASRPFDDLARLPVDAAQETLVLEGELASVQELSFAFRRAASRLVEMAGHEWHARHLEARPGSVPLYVARERTLVGEAGGD